MYLACSHNLDFMLKDIIRMGSMKSMIYVSTE